MLNVKRPLLERIARCTGAFITPSVDKLSKARLGHCELFRLERMVEDHESANHLNKKPSKTLMFFEGCPRRLGCTVISFVFLYVSSFFKIHNQVLYFILHASSILCKLWMCRLELFLILVLIVGLTEGHMPCRIKEN